MSSQLSKPLNSHHINSRIEKISFELTSSVLKWGDLESHLRNLRETIERELKEHFFYRYPFEKGKKVKAFLSEWGPILDRFGEAGNDAYSAVDCYGLGHNQASIYHSMMVLESGLPALARRLKVKFKPDKATWAVLIRDIKIEIDNEVARKGKQQKGSKPIGLAAAARRAKFLADCQEAALQFGYFKDIWRNHVAHGRANYDENDALKVLTHVRDFMEVLAIKLKLGKRKP